MSRPSDPVVHDSSALGWTHVWCHEGDCIAVSDEQAFALVFVGLAYYQHYRVYRPLVGVTRDQILGALGITLN